MIPYNPQGLTPEEVAASRAAHGENIITPQRDDSAWRLLAEKFRDPIIIVLLVAAALSLAMAFMEGNFTETIGILCAILLATCVGFLFEWDAMRRFRRLNRVNDEQPVKVRRGGVMREIPRREVVVGDLVSLEAGETVPADGELVEAVSLQMDESTLTGEPETAKYVDEELFDPEATYPSNRLLRGTTVRDGYGRMVVTAVGDGALAATELEKYCAEMQKKTGLKLEVPHKRAAAHRPVDSGRSESAPAVSPDGGLFSGDMVRQLNGLFAKMGSPLILRLTLDERPVSRELENYMEALARLTDKLTVEKSAATDGDGAPCVKICRADGSETGVAFHGVPGGHEFTSFVLGLYNLAGPGSGSMTRPKPLFGNSTATST